MVKNKTKIRKELFILLILISLSVFVFASNSNYENLCIDSDGGKNYSVKGFVSFSKFDKVNDSCNKNVLKEYYCKKGDSEGLQKSYDFEYYNCLNGCSNGACVGGVAQKAEPCNDIDNDGYGNPASNVCTYPGLDCNDEDSSINPGADDNNCNGIDENCDGVTDEDYILTSTTCGKGECKRNTGELICLNGVKVDSCNSLEGASPESCEDDSGHDGLDNNCDGIVDLDCESYCDKDGDGYSPHLICLIRGYSRGDCDDTSADINPGATEIPCNGIDENCDGVADKEDCIKEELLNEGKEKDFDEDEVPDKVDCNDYNKSIGECKGCAVCSVDAELVTKGQCIVGNCKELRCPQENICGFKGEYITCQDNETGVFEKSVKRTCNLIDNNVGVCEPKLCVPTKCVPEPDCLLDSDMDGIPNAQDYCKNKVGAVVNQYGCPMPIVNKFKIEIISDLTHNLLHKIKNFTIRKRNVAEIKFNEEISLVKNVSGVYEALNFDEFINISHGKIEIKTNLTELNKSAIITMYNISLVNPYISRDGERCEDCEILSYENQTLKFTVPHFSVYEILENEFFCGDGVCNASESCTSCSLDCGDCPSTGSSSSGSSGGGSSGNNKVVSQNNYTVNNSVPSAINVANVTFDSESNYDEEINKIEEEDTGKESFSYQAFIQNNKKVLSYLVGGGLLVFIIGFIVLNIIFKKKTLFLVRKKKHKKKKQKKKR